MRGEFMMERTCTKCGICYPATKEFFYVDRANAEGLTTRCKACRKVAFAGWRVANLDRARELQRQWRQANPERVAELAKESRERYPERVAARNKAWHEAHPEYSKESARAFRLKNPTKDAEYGRRWRESHAGQHKERNRRWAAENPEKAAAKTRRRHALKKGAAGTHTVEDVRKIYNDQDGLCFWCDCELGGEWHVDHQEPLSKGGSNGPENLVVACPTCNKRKWAYDPMEFLERMVAS